MVFFARGMKKELRFDKPCAGKDILQIGTSAKCVTTIFGTLQKAKEDLKYGKTFEKVHRTEPVFRSKTTSG